MGHSCEVKGSGQGRGNSGVLIHGWGEVLVLDSFENCSSKTTEPLLP